MRLGLEGVVRGGLVEHHCKRRAGVPILYGGVERVRPYGSHAGGQEYRCTEAVIAFSSKVWVRGVHAHWEDRESRAGMISGVVGLVEGCFCRGASLCCCRLLEGALIH